jgi:hypothetical protein
LGSHGASSDLLFGNCKSLARWRGINQFLCYHCIGKNGPEFGGEVRRILAVAIRGMAVRRRRRKWLAAIENRSRSQNGEFVGSGGLYPIHARRHRSRHVTITCLILIEQGLHSLRRNIRVVVGSIYTNGPRDLLYLEPGMGRGSIKLSISILRASRHLPVTVPSTPRLHR